jgi:ABC-type multidrug transport system fused ATPase/permease subunit
MELNNIFVYLVSEFFKENLFSLVSILVLSGSITLLYTNGISKYTANIFDKVNNNKIDEVWSLFMILGILYLVYQIAYHFFYGFQIDLIQKIKPWGRYKLMELIMNANSNIFSEDNFTKLNSPIHRIADLIAAIISDIMAFFLPNLLAILLIFIYFLFVDYKLSTLFLAGNLLIVFAFIFLFNHLIAKNKEFEKEIQVTDGLIIDLLNNMDKIIYRGKIDEESEELKNLSKRIQNYGVEYYNLTNLVSTIMTFMLMILFLLSFGYLLKLVQDKKITNVKFMSSITILILFRENIAKVFEQLPDFAGFVGRMDVAFKYFQNVSEQLDDIKNKKNFKSKKLEFDNIEFKNVSYKYSNSGQVFKNKNIKIKINKNDVIGITGPSGSGKSTLIKLLIKMYPLQEGEIFIDGVNIDDIEPLELRKQITYVNQTSKLFDKKVIDNILYGCMDKEICNKYLDKIMKYPKISELYKNIDIYTKQSGQLGENLSGGQRQIINMIGGLINNSKILVLDEPTNALDPQLKNEVIGIIKDFREYKKAIFIITHDKDVFEIFNQQVKL